MSISTADHRIEPGELKHYLEQRTGAPVQIQQIRQLRGEAKGAAALEQFGYGRPLTAHTHYWEHQVFVLAGRGVVIAGDQETLLREGDLVYIPSQERHQFVNRGKQPFRFLMALPIP